MDPNRTYLVLMFDVTGLPEREIAALDFEAGVQSETSSDYTEGEEGHRGVPEPQSVVLWSQNPPIVLPSPCDFLTDDELHSATIWDSAEEAGPFATTMSRDRRGDVWPPPNELGMTTYARLRYMR